jgi:hypothetical protein
MHIAFALFADAANISQEGKLNILGVFDALQVGVLPAVHPRATVVLRLKGTRDDIGVHTLQLSWRNPTGDELWTSTGELNVANLPAEVAEMDMPLIAAVDLPMDLPGEYTMRVALDDEPRAALTLQVRAAEQAMMPAMTGLLS